MTEFNVFLSKIADKFLLSLDEKTRERIKSSLRELGIDPYRSRPGADIKKLHGFNNPDMYRLRVGDFRAMYFILNAPETAAFRRHVLEAHSGSHLLNKPAPLGAGIKEDVISDNSVKITEIIRRGKGCEWLD